MAAFPKALKSSMWLVVLLTEEGGLSLAIAVIILVFALVQSLYACWITPRLYACEVLKESMEIIKPNFSKLKCIGLAVLSSLFYYCFWLLGLASISADKNSQLAQLYAVLLLLSIVWTMQTIRCVLHVSIARIAYMKPVCEAEVDSFEAFSASAKQLLGNVCYGAIVVPTIVSPGNGKGNEPGGWGFGRVSVFVCLLLYGSG